jgi:hypothetical protein
MTFNLLGGEILSNSAHHHLVKEETLSSRIGDACNDVRFSNLYGFCLHSEHQIKNCFKQTPF